MSFVEVMEVTAQGFEAFGAAVLVLGLLWSLGLAVLVWRRSRQGQEAYRVLRSAFGGVLLLGLEILVAADLIKTVAVATTIENVGVLGLIVLIRTFLSFSLEVEQGEEDGGDTEGEEAGAQRAGHAATARHRYGARPRRPGSSHRPRSWWPAARAACPRSRPRGRS